MSKIFNEDEPGKAYNVEPGKAYNEEPGKAYNEEPGKAYNEEPVKTLNDEDVEREIKNMQSIDPDVMNDIYKNFSNAVMSIVTAASEQTEDEKDLVQLDRIKRILNLAPMEERFIRSKEKVWGVRNYILNKNVDYFLNKDYSGMIKKDHNQVLLEKLIEIVRDNFINLSAEDKEFYWKKANILLHCVAKYKKMLSCK
jgi:hypothetical protein